MISGLDIHMRNLGPLERIPVGEGRSYRLEGEEIAVFRTRDGGVYATQAYCPHRQGPLADGLVGSGTVFCPLHAYAFELETGAPIRGGCPALRTYAVEVSSEGDLLVGDCQPME